MDPSIDPVRHVAATGPGPVPFRGWRVVVGAFGVMAVGFGCAYSFGAFLASLQQAFGASRGTATLAFAVAGFLYFGFGIVSGPLADRYGVRRIAALGVALIAIGLALASVARTLPQLLAAYGLGVGLGVGCAYVPAVAAVQRWFARRRGLASGLAVSGIGVGTLVVPPIASLLVDALGWRHAWLLLAVFAAVAGGLAVAQLADDPRRYGERPDGDAADPAPTGAHDPVAGATLREALASRAFRALYAAGLIAGFAVFVPFVHLVPYAIGYGVAPAQAALLIGAIGVGSTVGRFALGGLMDRIGGRPALVLMFIGMALTLAAWPLLSGFEGLVAFALLFGTVYGGWVAVMPGVVMERFGGRAVGGIIGALYTSVGFGALIGPTAAGYAYDVSGSYAATIWAASAANLVAAAIVLRATGPAPGRRVVADNPRRSAASLRGR